VSGNLLADGFGVRAGSPVLGVLPEELLEPLPAFGGNVAPVAEPVAEEGCRLSGWLVWAVAITGESTSMESMTATVFGIGAFLCCMGKQLAPAAKGCAWTAGSARQVVLVGRLRIRAARSQVATTSPFWLVIS
jgi:hypothetical protein